MCLVCFQKTIFRDKGSFLPRNPQEGDAKPSQKRSREIRTGRLFPVCTGEASGSGQKKFLGLYPAVGTLSRAIVGQKQTEKERNRTKIDSYFRRNRYLCNVRGGQKDT